MSKTYTVKEVADLLGFSTNSIYTFIKEKRIEAVKVGKGRFRISEEELKKLLHVKSFETTPQKEATPIISEPFLPSKIEKSRLEELYVPSFSDWFAGIGSIIIGFSVVLYTAVIENPYYRDLFDVAKAPIQTTYLVAGIGLLITDMLGMSKSIWHRVFHIILALVFLISSIGFARMQDFAGAGLFGLIGIFLVLQMFVRIKSVIRFAIFTFCVVLIEPILILISFTPITQSFLEVFFNNQATAIPFWIILISLSAVVMLWSRKTYPLLSWTIFIFYAFTCVFLSIWYVQNLAWAKSLLFLLIATFCLFSHWWTTLDFTRPMARLKALIALSTVAFTYIAATVTIYAMQQNTITVANQQLQDKASYGSLLVDHTLHSVETTVEQTARNSVIVTTKNKKQLKEEDIQTLNNVLRDTIEITPSLRVISILDENGYKVTGYPYNTMGFDVDLSNRDYFQNAVNNKKTFTTEVFTSNRNRPAIVIASPILTDENKVIGVVVGSLDFNNVNKSLQQAATQQFNEYYYVTDKNNKYIIHPEIDQIGKAAVQYSVNPDITYGKSIKGKSVIVASAKSNIRDWVTTAKIPLTTILTPKTGETIIFFALMTFFIAIFITLITANIKKSTIPREDTS